MALSRDDVVDLVTAGFDEATLAVYPDRKQIYDKVLTVKRMKSKSEKVTSLSGLSEWTEYDEGSGAPEELMVQMYDEELTAVKSGVKTLINFETIEDDRYAIVDKALEAGPVFADGWHSKCETDAASIFLHAFDTGGSYNGADGVCLCNDSHPKNPDESSTYYDNKMTAAFSHAALAAAETQISTNLKSPKGIQISMPTNALLLYPPALNNAVQQVLHDRAVYETDSLARNVNIYSNGVKGGSLIMNYTPVPWEFLASQAAYWFIVFPKFQGLRWYWRIKPKYKGWIDEDGEVYKFRGRMRAAKGWTGDGYRSAWGSDGTG